MASDISRSRLNGLVAERRTRPVAFVSHSNEWDGTRHGGAESVRAAFDGRITGVEPGPVSEPGRRSIARDLAPV
jgi:hypothetical protein